jgi:hypothetical protein
MSHTHKLQVKTMSGACTHMSSSTGPCPSAEVGSRAATCSAAPDPTSLLGGIRATTRPTVLCGSRASNIKKSLAGLPVQQSAHVSNACMHISKAPDVRIIMDLQDVWGNACKMCGYAATV